MKKFLYIPFIVGGYVCLFCSACSTNTYPGRFVRWRASDIEDYQRFPRYEFEASSNPFFFFEDLDNDLDNLRVTQKRGKQNNLPDILRLSGTTAFLVIKDDTLLYEKYLNGYHRNSVNTSFSVAKSITSLLTGVAIDEQLIAHADVPVVTYIPELMDTDPDYGKLLLSHLLDMRSGIRFKDHDLPWGDKPRAYYDPKLRDRLMELPLEYEPGSRFRYNSYNPILVGVILERAANLPPARYFEQKLWNELGMEYAGSWSMDSKASGMTKMESGLNIRAIDFAKLGRLVLNKGNWNSKQLISEEWMNYSFAISEQYRLSAFAENLYYRNFWWIYTDTIESNNAIKSIAGTGHLGQYLYVFPEEKIIMVRMGKDNKKVDSWNTIFQEIVGHIQSGD